MLVHRYDPFRPFTAIDALLDEALRKGLRAGGRTTHSNHTPRARLISNERGYVLTAELPGIAPEDIHLDASADGVTLQAERKGEAPAGYQTVRSEREGFTLTRRWALPEEIDVEGVEAVIENGLLTVHLPRAAKLQPRRIEVRS